MLTFKEWVLLENIPDRDMMMLFKGANALFGRDKVRMTTTKHFLPRLQADNSDKRKIS